MLSIYMYEVGLQVSEWYMQECVYLKTAYCVRIFVHQVQSTVEAQTAEEAKILSKTESCDRKPVIDLPAGILFTLQLTEISTSFCVAMVQQK